MTEKTAMAGRNITISADGATLAGTYFAPPEQLPRKAIIVHGATGVPHAYYRNFGLWAVEQGYAVLTYDYRDFGASLKKPLKESRATMTDWGLKDQPAALNVLRQLVPEAPVHILGHSFGGLMFPFQSLPAGISGITTVGSGHAHFLDHPWHYLPKALAFWFGPVPWIANRIGYLPGRRALLGVDLPLGVYSQWRRWCTSRTFFTGDFGGTLPAPNFSSPKIGLRMLSADDDPVVPTRAVDRFAMQFPQGSVERIRLSPKNYVLPSLGHIAIFSKRCRVLWKDLICD